MITLAAMLAVDEGALICDFVEYYHITDIWALPVPLLATLASGLRENSRIRMKLSGEKLTLNETLEAIIADRLGLLFWVQSGAARTKKPRPDSILDALRGNNKGTTSDSGLRTYKTPADFHKAWKEITGN